MKSLFFSVLLLIAAQSQAANYNCTFSTEHMKWEGNIVNTNVSLQTSWWGSYYIKSGTYAYDAGNTSSSGILDCSAYEHGYQVCKPSKEDAVLERITTHPVAGLFVQVRGLAPIGPMQCEKQ